MRISGDRKSPDWWRLTWVSPPDIYLDGAKLEHCRLADDETGIAEVEVWKDGKMQSTPDGKSVLIEERRGTITFRGGQRCKQFGEMT